VSKQLSWDKETSFGNPSASAPIPDNSAAIFKAAYVDRANIGSVGEPELAQRDVTRGGFTVETPRMISICDGVNGPYERRMGSIQTVINAQTVGAGNTDIPTSDDLFLAALLASSLVDTGDPIGAAGVVLTSTAGDASQVVTVADTTGLIVGETLSTVIDGITEYTTITEVQSATEFLINPGLSRALIVGGGDVFYRMRTFYLPYSNLITPGDSLVMRLEGAQWRDEANGCRASAINLGIDGGEFVFDITSDTPYTTSDHLDADVVAGTNSVEPSVPAGPGSQPLGARQVMGTTPSNDATMIPGGPFTTSTPMDLDDISLSCAITLEKRGLTDNIMACSDQSVVGAVVELDLTLSTPLQLVKDDMREKLNRFVIVGAGRCGEGTGLAVVIPNGIQLMDPDLRLLDTELTRQSLKLGLGQPSLDDTGGTLGGLAGSIFRISIGVQGA